MVAVWYYVSNDVILASIYIHGGAIMPDYEKMYLLLFNSITDALEALEDNDIKKAQLILKRAQITAEDEYIES